VDLDQQDHPVPEAATPLVSFNATDSEAVADASSQVEETAALALDSGVALQPSADVSRRTTAIGNYAAGESSDPTKSPVTHTQAFGGVDVQPSTCTAPATPGFPVLEQPPSYDLRTDGHVTPVKNQGNIGSCWAFGTYGSLESSILVDGGPATDLSENHLKNYHGFDWGPTAGGNYYMSEAYLSRWDGPVSEADDPYHDSDDRPSPGGPPQYYVREVLEFDSDSELKDGLMTYGAIGTVMYMNTTYYNATAHTYYYSGTANANHGVTIVGWDDSKAVPGAPGAGAWLIKNSWGTAWGDGGYFWLSYYDSRGANDGFSFTDAVAPSTFEKVYYHDYFGNIGGWNVSYGFNAYTASSEQDLTAVQFWTMADGAFYEVRVYDTFAGGQLTGLLGSTSGTSTFAGLHTDNLVAPVHLTAGNDFYIYLHITDGGTYPLASDWANAGYNSSCTASPGQSYYSSDGYTWKDLTTLDSTANFSIRGLVTTTTPPEITVLGNGVSISDGDITPASADGTNFGTTSLGGAGVSRTFTVRNDGTGNLVLGPVTVPTGFTLTDGLSSSLAPGTFDTFTVRLDAEDGGTRSGYIFIQNDDRDEHPFNFAITGTVLVQDVTVLGNGISIVDGDLSPSTSDGTDFGVIDIGGAAVSHTFTVRNDGSGTLTLGAVNVPTGFTLTEGLVASLGPGASDTFTVRLDVGPRGTRTGDVSFSNNDPDENPFNFRIQGSVLGPIQPGDLDVTFGTGGVVFTSFSPYYGYPQAVAIGSNGKIVVAGYCNRGYLDFAVARYNVNGELDTSFDGDGEAITTIGPDVDGAADVAIQSDGKILAVGYSYSGTDDDFGVVRYNVNGSLDTSFSGDGKVSTAIGSSNDGAYGLAIQSDGKIVVAGRTNIGGTRYFPNYAFAVVRYNTDGSLDTSFDGDGKVITAIGVSSGVYGVAIQPDGKIVVVGYSGDFALVRYNTNGSLDASFGVGGVVTTDFASSGDGAYSVVIQPDGKIVVCGVSNRDFALVRYNTNGSLDTSFSGDGKVTTDLGSSEVGYNVALQPDGKIVVSGDCHPQSAVVRYNANGSLDTSFGVGGIARTYYPSNAYGMALQSDGKIVLAGESDRGWAVARFVGDGPATGEVTVLGNGLSITDGDTTPSATDGTNFGSVAQGAAALSRVFTVRNDGGVDLTLGAVTVPTGFTLTEGLSASLAPGASDTFTVQLDAAVAGPKEGEVSFSTNDPDENPFNFRIAGTVGNLALGRSATASTSYSGLPASNATDGDLGSRWSSQFSDNEWIYVDLGSVYSVREVVLRWESAYGRGYKIQVSGDASTWSDVYSTTTGDGDVDDISLSSPASGRYVRMLGTQRATAFGYSLYELEVYGGAPGPEVTVLGSGISIVNGDSTPSVADGTSFGSVIQGGAALSRVFTVRNDGDSTLTLGTATVPTGFTLTEGLSSSLAVGASDTFTVQLDSATVGTKSGEISFANNDPDESPFHFAITGTVSPPVVTVAVAPAAVAEDGSANLVYAFTRSVADSSALTVGFSVAGTAVFGTDYAQTGATSFGATSGTVTLAASQTTAIVTVDPTTDMTVEPDETVILTVTVGTGYTVGTPSVSTGTIQNDDGLGPNLALGRPATASTSYAGLPASNATDGNLSSRWSSEFSDNEWIYVDLGAVYTVNRVVLRWEPAYGRGYRLQVSSDASGWSDVYSTTIGDGGVDDTALSSPALGRYVRMLGTQRATEFGYSLYELEVYGGPGGPEVTVLGNDVSIADGDTTPSAGDGTDFGSVAQGAAAVSRTFTVRNDGSEALTLGTVTVPAGFTLTEGLADSLAPGVSDTFTVQLDTATPGTKSGEITFSNNDADENPFNFAITGTVLAPAEITVLGNGIVIADGDTSPDTADNTDFGSVLQGASGISRTFTVRNDGDLALTLGTVTVPTGFTLTESLSASLAAGVSDTFTVRLDTATVGMKAGDISFATNDSDENPFSFAITGTVLPAPEITVLGNGSAIANGDTTPSGTDGTDFGWVAQGAVPVSRTFMVRNDGGSALTLGAVTVPVGFTLTEGLSASLAPGASDTFTVQLDTVTPGTKVDDISFSNNDSDENPFSFRITGTVWVAGAGDLDPTFGTGGFVTTDFGVSWEEAHAVALQSDGKIVLAGHSPDSGGHDHYALVRYNADGSLDTSFSGDGMVTTVLTYTGDEASSVAIQSDNKIVVAGRSYVTNDYDLSLVRYNTDGSLDTSFSGDGMVITPIGSGSDDPHAVAIQFDDKIVVAGGPALVRYNADGSLDTSFGVGGKVTVAIAVYSMALLPDGRIVVAGGSAGDFAVARYNPDGSLDTSFGGAGTVTTPVGPSSSDCAYSVALQSDGKIVAAGYSISSTYDFAAVRYSPDGSLDTSFSGDGKVTTDFALSEDHPWSMAIQSDGKIVMCGETGGNFALVRYNTNGGLDISFGADGKVTTNIGSTNDIGFAVAMQSDGKIVVAGRGGSGFAVARYIGAVAAPEITVLSGAFVLADGDTAPRPADGTDFGLATQSGAPTSRVFTVRNDGVAPLTLGAVIVPEGFTVTEDLSTSLAPGASDTFTIQLDTATPGTKAGEVSFLTNDSDENPFSFTITGFVQPSGPEITVLGNDILITDGDITPSASDGTDFGTVAWGQAPVSHTFTVRNNGSETLTLGTVSVPAGYTVTEGLSASLGPEEGDTFTVLMDTAMGGVKTGDISFSTNDADENPFNFRITGTVTAGSLDPTFGTGGIVITGVGSSSDYGRSVAVQPDGKIVVAGYSTVGGGGDFAVVRYNANGSLDTSFGAGGKITTAIGPGGDLGYAVAIQSDGKIIVAGQSYISGSDDFAVVRYNSDGSLDTSFDGDGKVTTSFAGYDGARAVAIQPDGKIVVAGFGGGFAVARYNIDGSLDTSFDGDGKVSTRIGSGSNLGYGMALQADGKIVVAGFSDDGGEDDFAVVRYNMDGSLDLSFGGSGTVMTPVGSSTDWGRGVAIQSDGKIVVVGRTYVNTLSDFGLVRYNPDGSLDASFGTGGKVITDVGYQFDGAYSVAIQPDGRIVAAGTSYYGGSNFALVQYNPDGSLDTSFGAGGKVTTAVGPEDDADYSVGMVVQADGKIVVAGENNYLDFAVARYNGGVTTAAEITVEGNGVSIADGDTTPSTVDGTDFGATPQGSPAISRVFTVRNEGGSTLTLGAVTVPTGFTLTEGLSTSLAAGASDTFTVQLDTATAGTKSGEISFATDDSDENPFNFTVSGTVQAPAPEITVLGNGVIIADGDATPDATDGTDFGSVIQGEAAISRTFTVRNDGSAVLTLGEVTVPAGFTLTEALASSLDPGASDTFTVQLDAATTGTKSGEVTFSNNDEDEDPFNFAITGAVLAPAEITVLGKGIPITDGDTSPDTADDTDFGSVPQGAAGISRTFTVRNDGDSTLTLGTVTVPMGFTLTEGLSASLGAGASDTFTVRLDTAAVGTKTGDISFATNDPDANPFDFRITGTVLPVPEITVLGNGNSIADGDTTPSASDGTDFGFVVQGDVAISRTFTVRNDGSEALMLGAVMVPTGYTLTEGLSASLAPGESDTFTVRLDTATPGTKADDISFTTNDPDENPFNFRITGRVLGPGELDPTFGAGGIVITAIGLSDDWAASVAIQSDGRIVVAGLSSGILDDFAVVRYNADGSLDTSFGVGGMVTTDFRGGEDAGAGVALQLDGKIVVAGRAYNYGGSNSDDFALVRYNANGSLDTSFGAGGMVLTAIGSGEDSGTSLAIQSDGKIVVAGYSYSISNNDDFAVVRYNADGSLDTSFGMGGKVTTPIGGTRDRAYSVALQSDGRIVVAGYCTMGSHEDFALVRYNADGSLDTSFGAGGKVTTDFGGSSNDDGYGVALQSDGKIVVVGVSYYDIALARYNVDGSLDTSFGVGGKVVMNVAGGDDRASSVAIQSDGKIVVAGSSLLRYNANGSLDTSFGVGGVVASSDGADVALQSNGRIVVAGTVRSAANFDFTVARYIGDMPVNPEITVLGNAVSIADGDTTPSPTDGTDFGSVAQGDPAISRVFTVRTDGSSTLTLGPVTVPTGFTLTEGLSTSLAPGASDTFTVRLDTTVAGSKTGDVSFFTNDYDENPFNFRITGMVVGAGNLALGRPATASTSYTGMPASNATDGDTASRWSSQFSDNEWIYVDLGSTYTITRIVLRWEAAYGRGYKLQVSGNASSWSDVYGTTTGDGGVDDITLSSSASGRYVRMLGTQRATMYGYSLYEFEVYGSGAANHAPAVSSFSKSLMQDTPLPFAAADFTGAFTDPDAGDSLQKIKITSLPTHGVLALNSTPVTVNQEIPVGEIGTLTYTPDSGYTGSDSFQWNGSDGSLYATTDAAVNLSINAAVANLALGKTAVAATSYPGLPASNATDGNVNSRWSSLFSDNQWIYVDLGSSFTISRVVLRWEAAYGRGYKIQVSGDASTWSDVYSTTTGDGGVDDITLASPASARYVRMLGTQRATAYGYSLYELEVYGAGAGPEVTVAVAPAAVAEDGAANLAYTFTRSVADSSPLTVSFSVGGTATFGTDYTQSGAASFNATSGTVTIGASQTTATVMVDPTADTTVEPDETVILTVIGGTGYTAGTPASSTGTIQNDDGSANLALGRPATASTSYSGLPASNATDGNLSSRWSSQFSDNQWIYVDLGSVLTINQVVLRWETAYGRGYKIQVSNDASTWSDVYSTTTGDGGVDDITLSSPASGRYVRMLGTQRATTYGYSLYELEVYGGGGGAPEITVLGNGVSITDGDTTPSATDHTDFGIVGQGGTAISRTFTVRNDGTAALTLGAVTIPAGFTLTEGLSASLAPGASDMFTVRLDTTTAGTKADDISFATNDSDENPFNFRITGTVTAAAANLALGKTAVASTSYSGLPASNATDGNLSSRWSSQFSDSQWIYVDLGAVYTINQVVLRWETAYGRGYKIQVSSDASTWSDVYSTTTGDGGVDDITLAAPASGRYVRLLGTQRATAFGYSLWEFEVYGS
jgi:uncharacterized delta-60 repeat protein